MIPNIISDLKNEVEAMAVQIEVICKKAQTEDRDLTIDEKLQLDDYNSRMDSHLMKIEGLANRDKEGKNKALNHPLAKALRNRLDGESENDKSLSFKSHAGEVINILSREQKVSNLHPQELPNGVGEIIRAKICGVTNDTPKQIRNAMSGDNNSLGGIMVPNSLSGSVIDIARAKSVLIQAGVVTGVLQSGGENTIAKVASQVVPQVKRELDSFTPQNILMNGVNLIPKTVGCYIETSRELAEDAMNFVQVVEDQLAKSIAETIDKYGIQGFGGTSLGLIGIDEINETGSIGAIGWTDLSAAVTRLREANHEPNSMIMYPSVHDSVFNSYETAFGWVEAPPSIRGKSFYHSTNVPSANIIVGDFTKMMFGIRTGLQIEVTTDGPVFAKHGVAIKATIRCDYVVLDPTAFERLAGVTAS